MKKSSLVSIIIPVKGRLQFVKEAINSIYSQRNINLKNIEIIISEEKNYGEVIRNKIKKIFPEVKTIINQDREGPGGGRNSGLKIAQGKYIVFLDSDDRLKPEFITNMLRALREDKNRSAAICFSDAFFEPSFALVEKIKLYLLMAVRDISLIISYFNNNNYLFPSAFYLGQISHMMFKTEAIKKVRFNYDYRRGGEDWDFFIRTIFSGPIRIVPKRLLYFRYSQNSSTSSSLNKRLKWLSYSKLASRLPNYMKKSLYYWLFLCYIKLFKVNHGQ